MTPAEPATTERPLAEPAGGDRLRRADLIVLLGLVAIAALLRLPGLAARGGWDADQGSEMIVRWRLIHDGQIPRSVTGWLPRSLPTPPGVARS